MINQKDIIYEIKLIFIKLLNNDIQTFLNVIKKLNKNNLRGICMLKELKQLLVGEEFVEDEYESDLNYILGQNGMELNSVDFDYDRIYNKGYLYNEDWSINFVASIEKEYFEKEIENNGMKHVIDMIRIIDIF